MKNKIILYLLTLVPFSFVEAQIFTNSAEVLSSGGGQSTGNTFSNFGVVAERFVNYQVEGGDYSTCIGYIYMISDSCSVSIEDYTYEQFWKVYPNPTTGIVAVSSKNFEVGSIAVYNFLGSKILSTDLTQSCDLSHLPNGVYIIRITDKAGRRNSSVRVVKTN